MENLEKRLELLELYCDDEFSLLYGELYKCYKKATNMCFMEYRNGEQEHWYSNLYSCVYDFKNKFGILNTMDELMQLMKDICFSVDKKYQVHNFKVQNCLYKNII